MTIRTRGDDHKKAKESNAKNFYIHYNRDPLKQGAVMCIQLVHKKVYSLTLALALFSMKDTFGKIFYEKIFCEYFTGL